MGYTGAKKREYNRLWMKARRDSFLEGKSCAVCGSVEELEVDHIDPSTKVWNPANIWSRKASDRNTELAKCQVLCKEHHTIKTSFEQMSFSHGASQYNRGCRCAVCKEAHRIRMAVWRASE